MFLSTLITGLSLLDGIQVIRPDMIHIVSYRSVISIEHMASADFAVFFFFGLVLQFRERKKFIRFCSRPPPISFVTARCHIT